jgi:hypothetical protein
MENRNLDRDRVQRIARSVLNRQAGVVDAARDLLPILRRCPEMATKEDFTFVVAIESETDELPRGQVRELWDPAVLPETDQETTKCEELWGDQFRAACERISIEIAPGPIRTMRLHGAPDV